jgi:hypothetical protein
LTSRLWLAALLAAAGCASSAPPLPPAADASGANGIAASDLSLDCPRVAQEVETIDARMREANRKIEGERTRNQVVGYFAAVAFAPLVLATEQNQAEKDLVRSLYARRDALMRVAAQKGCSLPL